MSINHAMHPPFNAPIVMGMLVGAKFLVAKYQCKSFQFRFQQVIAHIYVSDWSAKFECYIQNFIT